jgi:uncharacterized repeat protein (TIGR01451 family)
MGAPRAVYALCNCGYGDGRYTLNQNIVIDGEVGDWANVLADPDNNVCDGGSPNIEPQPDRDAPVQSTGRDLIQFSYTWDDSGMYTYTERVGSTANVQRFIYYADADNDGFMETGEPVILAEWKGANRRVELYVGSYVESSAGGDSMVDGGGYADGHTLPGTVDLPGNPDYQGQWGSADGTVMEWMLPWSDLGVSPGTGFTYHVASTNSQPGAGSFPKQVDDNLAGCGGGPGSTQYGDVMFVPDLTIAAYQDATVYGLHTLANTGNATDVFDLSSDVGGDFTPIVSYYYDADSSGTFTPADTPLTDTDGDGMPDTNHLVPGESLDILIGYTIAGDSSGSATVSTTATSTFDVNIRDSVTDSLTFSADIFMTKSAMAYSDPVNGIINPKAIPGAEIFYTLQVTNQGSGAVDSDTVVVVDPIPANTEMYVDDLDGSGSGPVVFVDGTTPSGLTYTFTSLSSLTDDLDFSDDGGSTYTYIPAPDGAGYDSSVSTIRINPKGVFNAAGVSSNPIFEIRFRVRVK